eukprot:jgi/Mesen1/4125/ME000218S03236
MAIMGEKLAVDAWPKSSIMSDCLRLDTEVSTSYGWSWDRSTECRNAVGLENERGSSLWQWDDCRSLECEDHDDDGVGECMDFDRHCTQPAQSKQNIMDLIQAERDQTVKLLRAVAFAKHIADDRKPCEVDLCVYVGSVGAANNREDLKKLNITAVLTVANAMEPFYPEEFQYEIISVLDDPQVDLLSRFDDCHKYINTVKQQGGKVLVHCFAGRSRSVTVVIAYLMREKRLRFLAAYRHTARCRPEAAPNAGFIAQLQAYERRLEAEGLYSQ